MTKMPKLAALLLASAALCISPLAAVSAQAASARQAQSFVNQSQRVLQQLGRDPALDGLLHRARGVLIIPSFGQAALVVGVRGGEGLAMAHNNGRWSDPAFYHVGGVNIGLQAGGAGGAVVMLLMTQNALNDIMGGNNFSLNANAGLSVIAYSAKARAGWGRADVIVWSDTKGLWGGASIGVSDVAQDQAENQDYYRSNVTVGQILSGHVHNPGATTLARTLDTTSARA